MTRCAIFLLIAMGAVACNAVFGLEATQTRDESSVDGENGGSGGSNEAGAPGEAGASGGGEPSAGAGPSNEAGGAGNDQSGGKPDEGGGGEAGAPGGGAGEAGAGTGGASGGGLEACQRGCREASNAAAIDVYLGLMRGCACEDDCLGECGSCAFDAGGLEGQSAACVACIAPQFNAGDCKQPAKDCKDDCRVFADCLKGCGGP